MVCGNYACSTCKHTRRCNAGLLVLWYRLVPKTMDVTSGIRDPRFSDGYSLGLMNALESQEVRFFT